MSGVDLTVYAEALISTVARGFYDDDVTCLIDVLLRDKFLRDDDMSVRLSLPIKQLRRALHYLEEEHLVKHELVDDLSTGGSQNTKFWYIDYNHAVHVIRLRVHLLQKKLERDEMRARSSSMYLCPGYESRACNGRYTETEAQRVVDPETGLFLCRECLRAHANNPHAPPRSAYALKLLDNQSELRSAMDNARRVRVQLSSKIGQDQQPLRAGVFDLLQKVRGRTSGGGGSGAAGMMDPITSNLPSENIAMGIGSKRIAGTGRTKGNLLKKQIKNGLVPDAAGRDREGNGRGEGDGLGRLYPGGTRRSEEGHEDELTFLKNAMGQEIAFELERGGGARANLLATKGRVRNKLVDAAAMRVGVDLGLVAEVIFSERERRDLARKRRREGGDESRRKKKGGAGELEFLQENLGKARSKQERAAYRVGKEDEDDSDDDTDDEGEGAFIADETDELRNLPYHERNAVFQAQYKIETVRQRKILGIDADGVCVKPIGAYTIVSEGNGNSSDEGDVTWEDG